MGSNRRRDKATHPAICPKFSALSKPSAAALLYIRRNAAAARAAPERYAYDFTRRLYRNEERESGIHARMFVSIRQESVMVKVYNIVKAVCFPCHSEEQKDV